MAFIMPVRKIDSRDLICGFAVPLDIKNDVIYCQKTLRIYLKVHQTIVSRMGTKSKLPPIRRHLDDLENEIYDINAEQKLLMLRLRYVLEDYYERLKVDNLQVDREIGNAYVSKIFAKYVDDPNFQIEPINVKKRLTEHELIIKITADEQPTLIPEPLEIRVSPEISCVKQESLLKPMAERFPLKTRIPNILKRSNSSSEPETKDESPIKQIKEENQEDADIKLPMSEAINTSRLNLLQALNKARNQNLGSTKVSQQPPPVRPAPAVTTKNSRYETKSPPSSSDDSPDTRESTPEMSDNPLEQAENNQEMFLRLFGLYTLGHSQYLMQRRSKRKKRNVQNNSKSDYHYGNLDLFERQNKRKKTFLYSPPTTRAYKKRKAEKELKDNAASSKSSSSVDRSSSSSPDQKLICNECMKNGDSLLCKCETCSGFFHAKCQQGAILKQPMQVREKICPACARTKETTASAIQKPEKIEQKSDLTARCNMLKQKIRLQQNRSQLIQKYKLLQNKLHQAQKHRTGLLKNNRICKRRMNKFLDIVKAFSQ